MSSTTYQYVVFLGALLALFIAIEWDFGRAFQRKFMSFRLGDIVSAQWISVFSDPLKLGRRPRLNLHARYVVWHVLVVLTLLTIGFGAVTLEPFGATVDALLPHFFTLAKENSDLFMGAPLAQIGVIALLLFLVARLPGDYPDDARAKIDVSGLRRLLMSYSRFRDIYILDGVLRGANDICRTEVRKDIVSNRICERKLTPESHAELFKNLLNECAQPSNAQPHQILMGYIDAKGAKALDSRLNTAEKNFRQEIRRETSIELGLTRKDDGSKHIAHVRNVGIAPQQTLRSLGLNHQSLASLPDGEYSLFSVDGKKHKSNLSIDVETRPNGSNSNNHAKFAKLRPPSPRLGRAYIRHILAHN